MLTALCFINHTSTTAGESLRQNAFKGTRKNYIKLVVIKKVTNNEESEVKDEETKKVSTKQDLERR